MIKRFIPLILAVGLTNIAHGATKMKTTEDKVSYSIGVDIGTNFKSQEIKINPELLSKGLKDAYSGGKVELNEQERQEILTKFQAKLMEEQQAKLRELAETNLKKGNDFLAENKKKKGVLTLDTGLQYEVLTNGPATGTSPKATDEVTVHYKGTLIDGTEFDSSYSRGEPATFAVNGVIPGWTQALTKMKPGDKWKVYIPAQLAYGESGSGPISPNSVLIFEVELISVNTEKA